MAATVVLVHGAWHGAWCFERVLDGLSDRGIEAIAVDLPGHGQDPGPMGDLHGDAARVTEVLDSISGPVILLGHSYGGAVITEAGTHPCVERLVYLSAFALAEGESCSAAAADDPDAAGIVHEGRPDMRDAFSIDEQRRITLDRAQAPAILYNKCDPRAVAWAIERLCAQPTVTLRQPAAAIAWREKPSTYVVCTRDMAVHPDLQRLMARRCTDAIEWESDHSPFLSKPELVVDLLSTLAHRA